MWRGRITATVVLLGTLMPTATAGAGEIWSGSFTVPDRIRIEATYRAADGERNRVTVTPVKRGFVLVDRGANVKAQKGSGCKSLGPNRAFCFSAHFCFAAI